VLLDGEGYGSRGCRTTIGEERDIGRREECTDEATANARKVFGFVVEVASYFGP
jgi:hypothetical protein